MKPTLKHHPSHYTYRDLLVKFAEGKPLSCEQLHFLARHEKALSSPHMDHVLKYYLKHYHHDYQDQHSFLMPREEFTAESIAQFKRRLHLHLNGTNQSVQFKFKPEQLQKFRALTYDELILYHGNQLLSGAPFHAGGIPHLVYFQWGNLFGVAKYVIMAEEKALKSNILIYFEDIQDRELNRCVEQYQQHVLKKTPLPVAPTPKPEPAAQPKPAPNYHSPFQLPRLSLSRGKVEKEDK